MEARTSKRAAAARCAPSQKSPLVAPAFRASYNDSPSDGGPRRGRQRRELPLNTTRQRPISVRYRPVRRRRKAWSPFLLVIVGILVALLLVTRSRASAGHSDPMAVAPVVAADAVGTVVPAPTPSPSLSDVVLPLFGRTDSTPVATVTPTALPTATSTPAPTPTPFYSNAWLLAHVPAQPPVISAKAAIVIDYNSRQIIYQLNPHEHLAQASTTKITLADVALDVAAPDLAITINKDATEVVPDHMGVQAGEILTLQELLYGALLDSGNDAGWAIAEGIGGLDHTVALMNQKVADLHLHDTHYVNPVGFDDPQHYTSVYDLAVITADAVTRHPLFKQIVGTKKEVIESTKTHGWFGPTNLNNLLWDYPGDWGVKVGWTDNAEYCLVTAATHDGHTVLVALLGSKDHFADGTTLLNYGFARIGEGER
jgi:D-alanyl-D-alanine carboxypeptidase